MLLIPQINDVWHFCESVRVAFVGTQNDDEFGQRFESHATGPWTVKTIPLLDTDHLSKVIRIMVKKISDPRLNIQTIAYYLSKSTLIDQPGVRQAELFINALVKYIKENNASNHDLNLFIHQLFYSFFRLNFLMVQHSKSTDSEAFEGVNILDYGFTSLADTMGIIKKLGELYDLIKSPNKNKLSLFSYVLKLVNNPDEEIEPDISGELPLV